MSDPSSGQLKPGALITDRLVVVRHLGSGGLGAVYEVEHKFTHHHRAVKVLHPELRNNVEVVERFLKEASAAGRIGNPHIVETFDAGHLPDGSPYLVMEFLAGRPLNDVLRWSGRLDVGLASALMLQICAAVQAAHAVNIVHRDLKPENLFLTEREGEAFIKVLDFGISKFGNEAADTRQTRSGIAMGTPLYMAPEQLRGAKNADARSDVYSLGIILYEMVSGHVPFAAESFAELAVKVLSAEAPALDGEAIPEEVRAIVARALQKDPAARFQTAAELGEALAPFASNRGVAQLLEDAQPAEVPQSGATFRRIAVDPTVAPEARTSRPERPLPFSLPPDAEGGRLPPPRITDELRVIAQGLRTQPPVPPPPAPSRVLWWILGGVAVVALSAAAAWGVARRAGGVETGGAAPVTSIAVLPFDNATGDAENEYLGDGLTESVMNQLSQLTSLRVTPRSSVFRAKSGGASAVEAGKKLGVDAVLTGELTQRQLIRAELIDVRTGALLWGNRWDRATSDIIAIQREIAAGAEAALVKRGSAPKAHGVLAQPSDPEAFRLYLKGRYHWNKRTADGLEKAAALFREALDRDPGFAMAWVGLGDSLALLDQYAGVPSKENCPKAKAAISRALELDDSLAIAHTSHALLLGHCDWNWKDAEAEFRRAIALDPNYVTAHHWFSLHLAYRGLFDRALAEAKIAQELDPLSLIANNAISVANAYAGDWDAVLEQSERLIQMDPAFPVAHIWKGRALRAKGNYRGALEAFHKAFELAGEKSFETMGDLGSTAALAGDSAEAKKWQARIEQGLERNPSGAIQLAMIAASLGEKDAALRWLGKAFESGSWFLVQIRFEPTFAPLRDDPRFVEMVKRVKVD